MESGPVRLTIERLESRELLAFAPEITSIDDVFDAMRRGDLTYDLNDDRQIDLADARFLAEEVMDTRLSDADLNGVVNFEDFLNLAAHFDQTDAVFADGDTNGDRHVRFDDFLSLARDFGYEATGRVLEIEHGAVGIPNRTIFDFLARRDDVPGAIGIRQVKFMVELDREQITFVNHHRFSLHFDFSKVALGYPGDVFQFNRETYFTDQRRFLAGSILAHDSLEVGGQTGGYTVEFWPTDPVKAHHVIFAMSLVGEAMPYASERMYYHPSGETQRQLFRREAEIYAAAALPTISTEVLFQNQTFAALNEGLAFGRLRVVDGTGGEPLSARDLVIFENIPNDLTHVAGVITLEPQTPLSHVNLRAKQNNTPNAFIRNALDDKTIQDLLGKTVRFEVIGDRYSIREATRAEVDEHFAQIRPAQMQFPKRDLSQREITPLADLRTADQTAFGAKAANLGELSWILPDQQVPDGVAIPFAMYDDFMTVNNFYEVAQTMMKNPEFQSNAAVRDEMLSDFRKLIRKGTVPQPMSIELEATYASLKQQFGELQPFRARSSTNNEDLVGFTGAGLYRSYTHRPDEGKLENTIRQVWSSLWTLRAFDEREFWRIDHLTAAMGVAIHPNFDFEQINGVAITKNIYDPNWPGMYVNAQVGEDLVTNPEDGAIPEEFLISAIGPRGEWELQYIRRSNLTVNGGLVLSPAHIEELRDAMLRIQFHFREVYGALGDPEFAMDIEFKVDAAGQLVIKQARPWVD